jgi:hypothetical protein
MMARKRKAQARSGFKTVIAQNVRAMRNKPGVRRRRKIEQPPAEEFPSTCPTAPNSKNGRKSAEI